MYTSKFSDSLLTAYSAVILVIGAAMIFGILRTQYEQLGLLISVLIFPVTPLLTVLIREVGNRGSYINIGSVGLKIPHIVILIIFLEVICILLSIYVDQQLMVLSVVLIYSPLAYGLYNDKGVSIGFKFVTWIVLFTGAIYSLFYVAIEFQTNLWFVKALVIFMIMHPHLQIFRESWR